MKDYRELIKQMGKAPDDYAAAIKGLSGSVLAKRPDQKNWAAKEIVCHMRDTEEMFFNRFQGVLAQENPLFPSVDMDRWAEERKYLECDEAEALASFRARRGKLIALLRELRPEQWERTGISPKHGQMTIGVLVERMAGHDANHLDQIKRALTGNP